MLTSLPAPGTPERMIGASPHSPSQPLGLPGRKTASGGLQPTGASGKNRLRYDFARRGAVLPQKSEDACGIVAGQTGGIRFTGTTVSLTLLAGITKTSGTFTNVRTGSTGRFVSYGVSVGLSVGAGHTSGYYDSISNFLGYAETLEASVSVFGSAFSANDFLAQNANNDITAAGAGASWARPFHFRLG